ncbi:serine/threonine protein kinase [Mangrovibacter sp. MFB070]|uniref:serine/threonine protein kinase n=1 Tax=Mangrovibacter sp. MFB070 TaxID=1224318 RepID=UPI0004DADA94|nr:serine/threonine protein kinase [Mangrovibacter sp. MFB070]KEA50258.1 serine/threonine protein kinase [Mangrovibacter sp. MFB070]
MTDNAFNFQTLNPDIIMDALFDCGIRVDSGLTALNSYENRVYQFMDEDRKRYVVKFYRPHRWSDAQIEEEHQFTLSLQGEGIPVVAPVLFSGQSLMLHEGFRYAVFPSAGGRQYENDNPDQMESVGYSLGRIHQIGRKAPFIHRPSFDLHTWLAEPFEQYLQAKLIPASLKDAFLAAARDLSDAVTAHWFTDFTVIRLHGDCHPGNILWRDGPVFVDFDDARSGPAIQDIWMLLNGERPEQRMQLEMIVEAYEAFCTFDTREFALIEPLRAMRMIYYLAWQLKRWDDPAFPRSFPWLQEEDFWRRQTAVFIEQKKVLQEPPLQLTPMY